MKWENTTNEDPKGGEDRVEALLRAARPEPAAPLREDRAQEIFARALALSGTARTATPTLPQSTPWWRRLALPAPVPAALWGGGVAGAVACSLTAVLLLAGGGKDRALDANTATAGRMTPAAATVAEAHTSHTGAATAAATAASARPSTPASGGPVLAAAAAPEDGTTEVRPSRRGRRRPAPAGIRPMRPATMLAGRASPAAPAGPAREEDEAPRLLIVASGGGADGRSIESSASAEDPFVIEGGAERLFVAVAEGVPADRPGRAEAGALREVTQVGPAGPAGIPGGEGPALPPAAAGEPRTAVVWAQASVATDEEPTLILTEMPDQEDPESAPGEEAPPEEEAPVLP